MTLTSRFGACALSILSTLMIFTAPVAADDIKAGDLIISHPWTRATPGGAQVGGGYLTIENKGALADKLLGGTSLIAAKVEVHEMAMKNNVMTMRPVAGGLTIPPGQTVQLAPGGYHIMMMGLKAPLKQGDQVPVTLEFERAGVVSVNFEVRGIGASDSGQMDHSMPSMKQPVPMNSDHKM